MRWHGNTGRALEQGEDNRMDRRSFLQGAVAAPLLGLSAARAQAQGYPSRTITMIVAFPPGGQADLAARPVAAALERILGRSVIVDNRAGAGGMLGNAAAARAEPDGHTLLMALSSMTFLPEAERLYDRKPSYEYDHLAPIARVLADPGVLAARADAPWKSVADLVADAKKRPGQISFSSSGNYGAAHVPFEMFQQAAGIKLLHVPYRGGGPALTAFLGAQVDITAQAPGVINPHARDGKVRLLAHWGGKPTPELAGIPTMIELGYRDVEYYIWAGLFAPKGTPEPVIARLREAMRQAMADPKVTSVFVNAGSPPAYMDQPEFAAFVEADAKRLIPVVRKIGRLDEK
jgi:tripartite-type tricarboxylate transporter receptor subunit TctC